MERYLFLILQGLLPGCTALGGLIRKPFQLTSEPVYLIFLVVVSIYLTLRLRKGEGSPVCLAALPLTLANCAVILFSVRHVLWVAAVPVLLVCGWLVFALAPRGWGKTLLRILGILALIPMILSAPLWLFATAMGHRETVLTHRSPDGSYTAIVDSIDSGALGGDTVVTIRNNRTAIPIGIGSFQVTRDIFYGGWNQWQDMALVWEDDHTLSINGIRCDVSDETLQALGDLSDALEVALPQGQVLVSLDDHGGFQGDGITYVKLQFTPGHSLTDQLSQAPGWHRLPLDDELKESLESGLFRDEGGNSLIPEISTGWYYFRDRHYQSANPYDTAELNNRASRNFTAAIYDGQTDTLYYFEGDT